MKRILYLLLTVVVIANLFYLPKPASAAPLMEVGTGYDDTSSRIVYTGSWVSYCCSADFYNNTVHWTVAGGGLASFEFIGTQVGFRFAYGTGQGDIVVKIDGVQVDLVSSYGTNGTYGEWTSDELENGEHAIEISTYSSEYGYGLCFDKFFVVETFPSIAEFISGGYYVVKVTLDGTRSSMTPNYTDKFVIDDYFPDTGDWVGFGFKAGHTSYYDILYDTSTRFVQTYLSADQTVCLDFGSNNGCENAYAGTAWSGWYTGGSTFDPQSVYSHGYLLLQEEYSYPNGELYFIFSGVQSNSRNRIQDGDMEQQPTSVNWMPTMDDNRYTFGRMDTTNLDTRLSYGAAMCKNGFQVIGESPSMFFGIPFWQAPKKTYSNVRQQFFWSGGTMYYRYGVKNMRPTNPTHYQVWVTNTSTYAQYMITNAIVTGDWEIKAGSVGSVPQGNYVLNISLASDHADYDAIGIDDVVIDAIAPPTQACVQGAHTTPTATIVPGMSTPTSTRTPTPMEDVGPNLVLNCGFSQGEAYWSIASPESMVVYDSDNYAYIGTDSSQPGFSQVIYWPGGTVYVKYRVNGPYNVYFQDLTTSQVFSVSSGPKMSAAWRYYMSTITMPEGIYKFSLAFPLGDGPTAYDNLSVAQNGYAACDGGTSVTPTSVPTSIISTPTMWPTYTMAPTSTVQTGTPTPTIRPSYTPFPTYTPWPTLEPTLTKTPGYKTSTPWPTYTPQLTYTPQPTYTMMATHTQEATSTPSGAGTSTPRPTYTPWPTYTPQTGGGTNGLPTNAPPVPPPPSYNADCNRPQNGYDIAHWVEYEKCQTLSFFSMSPNAVATYQALPSMFDDREPKGTFDEVTSMLDGLKDLLNQYDWDNGLPGTDESPDLGIFLSPDQTSPWFGGQFQFNTPSEPFNTTCSSTLTSMIGPGMAQGYCLVMNFLHEKGLMPWIQLIIDLGSIILFGAYIWTKWIDAGAN